MLGRVTDVIDNLSGPQPFPTPYIISDGINASALIVSLHINQSPSRRGGGVYIRGLSILAEKISPNANDQLFRRNYETSFGTKLALVEIAFLACVTALDKGLSWNR